MGLDSLIYHSMGPTWGYYALLKSKFRLFMHFQLSIIVLGNLVSHFLEMALLISKVDIPDSIKKLG